MIWVEEITGAGVGDGRGFPFDGCGGDHQPWPLVALSPESRRPLQELLGGLRPLAVMNSGPGFFMESATVQPGSSQDHELTGHHHLQSACRVQRPY